MWNSFKTIHVMLPSWLTKELKTDMNIFILSWEQRLLPELDEKFQAQERDHLLSYIFLYHYLREIFSLYLNFIQYTSLSTSYLPGSSKKKWTAISITFGFVCLFYCFFLIEATKFWILWENIIKMQNSCTSFGEVC